MLAQARYRAMGGSMLVWWISLALGGPLLPGDPAPPLDGVQWVAAPDGAAPPTWEELAGKVVLIDFWATWCGPCISAWPEVGRLARATGDDVVVVAVSPEPVAVVSRFLQRRGGVKPPWIAAEAEAMHQAWGISSLPTYGIVGPDGRVRGVEAHLPGKGDLQAARSLEGQAEERNDEVGGTQTFGPSRASKRQRFFIIGANSIHGRGLTSEQVVQMLTNLMPANRWQLDVPLPGGRWAIDFVAADGRSAEALGMEAVGEAWQVAFSFERVPVETLIFDGSEASLEPSSGGFGCGVRRRRREVTLVNCGALQAGHSLEQLLGVPVVVEGLDGEWDWPLPWSRRDPVDAVRHALTERGFQLREEVRELPGVRVRPRDPAVRADP